MERRHHPGPDDRGHQPAGFEGFFRDVADLAATGEPAYAEVVALATAYGLEFEEAPWLPDVIARYHLTE